MLGQAAAKCGGEDAVCVKKALREEFAFDEHGFLSSRLLLKTVREGRFVGMEAGENK